MATRRALLVGAGGFSQQWAKALAANSNVELAGWVSRRRERIAEAARAAGVSPAFAGTDLGVALAELKPDFVVDVSPPEAHHDVTLAALAAGVPVLGEKPMASSLEQARAMVRASEQSGKLYMVSQSRRYNANLRALRGLISEHVGALGVLNSDFYIGAHFGGFRDEMPSPLLLDMAIHTFDAARYLSQADPVAVYCEEFSPAWSWYRGNAAAFAIFEMTGGLRYAYRGSWCTEGGHTSWESEWRAAGPRGTALWNGHSAPRAEVVLEPAGFHSALAPVSAEVDTQAPAGIAGALVDFLHALESGETPMGECHDNIKSLAMVFAALESAASGTRVPVRF
jgi:predicted dehydrogenase